MGKSFGCEIDFKIEGDLPVSQINASLPDQIHYLVSLFWHYRLIMKYQNFIEIIMIFKSLRNCSKTGTTEEAIANAEKIGFKTNLVAINPLNPTQKVPVYFANFVLIDYGFGAVLGVSS